MTTIIQACTVETQFIETTTVKLKVASQKSLEFSPSPSCNNYSLDMNSKAEQASTGPVDFGGWSFLQALSNVSSNPREKMDKQNVYVHPFTKQYSSSRLSEKSMELCTENLGSETGSDIMDCDILSLSLSPSKMEKSSPISEEKQEQNPPPKVEYSSYSDPNSNSFSSPKNSTTKVINNSPRKFPPPLTTLSNGTSSLQFRPHREEGRLVITAVEAPSKHPYFKAERGQGRLRLTFMEDIYATKFDSPVSNDDVIQENDVDESEDDYEESVEEDNDFNDDEGHHHDHQLDDEDDDHDEENGASTSKEINGNIFDIEVEVGSMDKFQRLINSRCNEGGHGNKGLCISPLWVASS